jgi:hypothetical protein
VSLSARIEWWSRRKKAKVKWRIAGKALKGRVEEDKEEYDTSGIGDR